jgi:hypothetical protein
MEHAPSPTKRWAMRNGRGAEPPCSSALRSSMAEAMPGVLATNERLYRLAPAQARVYCQSRSSAQRGRPRARGPSSAPRRSPWRPRQRRRRTRPGTPDRRSVERSPLLERKSPLRGVGRLLFQPRPRFRATTQAGGPR